MTINADNGNMIMKWWGKIDRLIVLRTQANTLLFY